MTVELVPASIHDVPHLAVMYKRLIEDERSRNPMSIPELEERMREFLEGAWKADLTGASPFDLRPNAVILGSSSH